MFQAEDKGVACPPLSSGMMRCVRLLFRPCVVVVVFFFPAIGNFVVNVSFCGDTMKIFSFFCSGLVLFL